MSDETALIEVAASVYHYDLSISNWASSDAGSSRLFLFHTPSTGSYRVIAQSQPDQNFVVNSTCHGDMKPQKLSDTFFQIKDVSGTIYGVNAGSTADAANFLNLLTKVVDDLNAPPTPDPAAGITLSLADRGVSQSNPVGHFSIAPTDGASKKVTSSDDLVSRERRRTETARSARPPRLASQTQSSYIPSGKTPRGVSPGRGLGRTPRVEGGLLTKDVATLNARENIVKEIFTSEASYVKSLNQLVEGCLRPVKGKKGCFSPQELKTVFSNIEVIRNFNNELMEALRVRLKSWDDASTPIGDLFLAKIPFLKLYNTYCNNYETAAKLLEKIGGRKNVREYLKNVEVECGMGLNFLLIMPVQRVPRYKMLFEDLQKNTDASHPDLEAIKEATVKIKEIANDINKSVLVTQSNETVSKLKKKVAGLDKLIKPGRSLLKEAQVSVKMGDVVFTHLFLFTDLAVFGAPSADKKKKIQLKTQLKLAHTWVDELRDSTGKFQLITPDASYLVSCHKSNDKDVWVDVLNKAINAYVAASEDVKVGAGGARTFALSLSNGDVYQGRWVNGKRDGLGTQKFASTGNVYEGDWQEGFFHGEGLMKYGGDSAVYTGPWEKGKPSGAGKLETPRYTYEGQWFKGAPHGEGKITWVSGTAYEGGFQNGKRHGKGSLSNVDGTTYEGEWQLGVFAGQGRLVSTAGTYEGGFENGTKHGKGKIVYANGDSYDGEWQADLPYGRGTMLSADGTSRFEGAFVAGRRHGPDCECTEPGFYYKGEYKNNFPAGEGVCRDASGEYAGGFLNGKKHGQGKMTYADESTYEGGWKEGRRDGKGTQMWKDGSRYDGQWNNDRVDGTGVMRYTDGAVYSGKWKLGRRSGQGVYQTKGNAHKYVGDWVANVRQGKGTLSSALGTFEGDFANDLMHGPGVYKYADGSLFAGVWESGYRHGPGTATAADGRHVVEQRYDMGLLVMPRMSEAPPDLGDPPVVMRF